ncbi:MAG: hypothetical protein GY765_32590 [bacterium]|nr:hypothetical protein [bacterium]
MVPTEYDEKNSPVSRVLAQFKASETEQQFRLRYLKSEKIQLMAAICVFIFPNTIFTYSDHILFGFKPEFYTLLVVRGAYLLFSIILLALVPRIKKTQTVDITTLAWWTSLIALVFYVNSTRPPEYIQHSVIDILIVFIIYLLVSNRLILQVIPALLFSIGNILFIATTKTDMSTMAFNVLWVSHLIGNMLGIFVSRRLNISHRFQFDMLQEETQLREKLEKSLSEVKTLRGIIPICSHCKQIRDDDGFWQKVEIYVAHHSEANFSHGLCPDCLKALYPAQYEKLKENNLL